jgi:hypothetical protein
MNVLAPNQMGDVTANRGVNELVANIGLGVNELMRSVNPKAALDRGETANPETEKNKLRVAKARQYGVTKDEVGF